jgi:hypothetical protein
VVAVREVPAGRAVHLGTGEQDALPRPDDCAAPDVLIAPKAGGWELDPKGATGGALHLSGLRHDIVQLGGVNARLGAGDYGLVEYGTYGVLFQVTQSAPLLERERPSEGELRRGFVVALIVVGTVLGFAVSVSGLDAPKPAVLSSPGELAQRFRVHAATSASAAAIEERNADVVPIDEQAGELALALAEIGRAGPGPRVIPRAAALGQPVSPGSSAKPATAQEQVLSVRPEGPNQGLASAQLVRAFAPRLSSLYACYALAAPEAAEDELQASIAVEPNGRINERVDVHSQIGGGVLERCVARKIGRIEFARARKPTQASVRIAYTRR